MVAADQVHKAEPREAFLRPHRLQPGDGDIDAAQSQFLNEGAQHGRSSIVDLDQGVRLDDEQPQRSAARRALDLGAKIVSIEKRERRLQREHLYARRAFSRDAGRRRPPDRCARDTPKLDCTRPRRRPDAIEKRQDDADADALLDRQDEHRNDGREDQQEFGAASFPHVDHRANPHDAQRDKEKNASQRRARNVGDRACAEYEYAKRQPGGDKARELRGAAALGDDGGAWRARINRERACDTGQKIGDADAEKVAADIGIEPARKGACRRSGLHHDDQGDDDGERPDGTEVGERDQRPREPKRAGGYVSERGDTARFQA